MNLLSRDPDAYYYDTHLWVPKKNIGVNGLKTALTIYSSDDHGEREDYLWRESEHHLLVPRCFWPLTELPGGGVVYDTRPATYPTTNVKSRIVLDKKNPSKTTQKDALRALLSSEGGILQLACGKGKTVIALELIAQSNVPALIIVDNSQLFKQWEKEIQQFLILPNGLGYIRGQKNTWQRDVVLTTYQTLASRAETIPEEVKRHFGLIIWDEGHHVGAPTFSKSAELFYGKRVALTATPFRSDGMHVIYEFHVGKVIYKDLTQDAKPRFEFHWTGIELDPNDSEVMDAVNTSAGELHYILLASYLGTVSKRVQQVMDFLEKEVKQGRKVVVLTKSESSAINHYAAWNSLQIPDYQDLLYPTPEEVGFDGIQPAELEPVTIHYLKELRQLVEEGGELPSELDKESLDELWEQHLCHRALEREYKRRQKQFVNEVRDKASRGGLMIYKVPATERLKMAQEEQVIFATAKYGKEGLDAPNLNTMVALEPFSDRNALQQFMGRVLRGVKDPKVVFFEDNIGETMGMCTKLKGYLKKWPEDEGGPHDFELMGHPKTRGESKWKKRMVPVLGSRFRKA